MKDELVGAIHELPLQNTKMIRRKMLLPGKSATGRGTIHHAQEIIGITLILALVLFLSL